MHPTERWVEGSSSLCESMLSGRRTVLLLTRPDLASDLWQHPTCGRHAVTATLTWWGHSTITWQDGDTTVLFDPVLTARLGHLRRVRGPVPAPHAAHADFVLISHLHADHAHLPSLRLIPASAVSHRPGRLAAAVQASHRTGRDALRGRTRRPCTVRRSTDIRLRRRPRRPPTSLEALIADPLSAIWSRDTTDAGIRETRVRNSRLTRWRRSTSP